MRTQTLHSKINRAFEVWNTSFDNTLFIEILPRIKKEWRKYVKEDGDSRSGNDTYGYEEKESIKNNMIYISDRWRCSFRLKWLIDGIENGKI